MSAALYLVADNPLVPRRDRRDRALARVSIFLRTARLRLCQGDGNPPADRLLAIEDLERKVDAAIALIDGIIAEERQS